MKTALKVVHVKFGKKARWCLMRPALYAPFSSKQSAVDAQQMIEEGKLTFEHLCSAELTEKGEMVSDE